MLPIALKRVFHDIRSYQNPEPYVHEAGVLIIAQFRMVEDRGILVVALFYVLFEPEYEKKLLWSEVGNVNNTGRDGQITSRSGRD